VTRRIPVARREELVGAFLERIAGRDYEVSEQAYVVDDERRLVGRVTLPGLLGTDAGQSVGSVAEAVPATVRPDADQEHAAVVAMRHDLDSLPVTEADGRLVGVLTPRLLMTVLRAEHLEDLHRRAGIRRHDLMARDALESPPLRRARDRLPWLLVGLAGSAVATAVMAGFETTMASRVAVAFFVPGIVYLADAIGTQTEAAAVRGVSLSHEPLGELIWGELRTGLVVGAVLAAIALPGVWLVFADLPLALAVAGALLFAGASATTIGLVLPWALTRLGRDPAYGSGPLATVIQDVLSLAIYFAIVTLIVR
jgi:magnesium transporter